jgi:lipopolysaccharide biosynthesis regulator YciM
MVTDALLEVSSAHREQGNLDQAVEVLRGLFDRIGEEESLRLEITYRIAEIYMDGGKEEKAEEEYIKLREMRPAGNVWRLNGLAKLGSIYEKREEWRKAIEVYEDFVRSAEEEKWVKLMKERIQQINEFLKAKESAEKLGKEEEK